MNDIDRIKRMIELKEQAKQIYCEEKDMEIKELIKRLAELCVQMV